MPRTYGDKLLIQLQQGDSSLLGVRLGHRVVAGQGDIGRPLEGRHRLEGVLGDVDEHRAGPASGRDLEGLADRRRDVANVFNEEVVLHAGPRDADGVDFLERVLSDRMGRHLAADDHHRDRIHVGGRNAGHGVGDARPAGHQTNTDFFG